MALSPAPAPALAMAVAVAVRYLFYAFSDCILIGQPGDGPGQKDWLRQSVDKTPAETADKVNQSAGRQPQLKADLIICLDNLTKAKNSIG